MRSILSREVIEDLLITAKKNLERYGSLQPVLFVQLANGERLAVAVSLSGTGEEKRRVFTDLRTLLQRQGRIVDEAVLLSEGWFVDAQKVVNATLVPPSQHPQRQEAITLVGRDAHRTRTTCVVQPFGRTENGQPTWQEAKLAMYDVPVGKGSFPVGIIDCLFDSPVEVG